MAGGNTQPGVIADGYLVVRLPVRGGTARSLAEFDSVDAVVLIRSKMLKLFTNRVLCFAVTTT